MLAAVLKDFDRLELEDVPVPKAGHGEVVVRIRSCGICATDYKAIKGIRRNVRFPLIPGHEPSGVVTEVGTGVTHVREGDEVIVQPLGSCGVCRACREGDAHYCENGFVTGGDGPDNVWPGAFAEYMKTTARCLYPKPSGVSFDAAAITEPLAGAWKGLIHKSQMRVGDSVVVIGVGSIGLLCMMVARAAGAGHLIAIDTSAYARDHALRLGATHALDPREDNVRDRVYEIMSDGPDVIMEAAGPIEAVKLMVGLLRRGTRWNIFGITTHETFELDGGLMHFLEAPMDASFGTTPQSMQKAIRLMEAGLVDPEKIITHRFPLTEIHKALEVMARPDRNKIIIRP